MNNLTRPQLLTLTNPKAIDIFLDVKKSRWLEPFMKTPRSLKSVSEEMGTAMGSYSYWLKQLLRYKLLTVAYKEKRRGSSIKYYWGAAERFEFGLSKTVFQQSFGAAGLEYFNEILAGIERALHSDTPKFTATINYDDQGDLVFRFKRQGDETTLWQAMLRPTAPALFSAFRDMQLSFADAKALQKELNDLLEKYEAKVNLEKPHYRVVVGLAETSKPFEK